MSACNACNICAPQPMLQGVPGRLNSPSGTGWDLNPSAAEALWRTWIRSAPADMTRNVRLVLSSSKLDVSAQSQISIRISRGKQTFQSPTIIETHYEK